MLRSLPDLLAVDAKGGGELALRTTFCREQLQLNFVIQGSRLPNFLHLSTTAAALPTIVYYNAMAYCLKGSPSYQARLSGSS